jgi:sortase (surface protein transpeptidase)
MNKNINKRRTIITGLILIVFSFSVFIYAIFVRDQVLSQAQNFLEQEIEVLATAPTIIPKEISNQDSKNKISPTLPPKDNTLPNENRISIPKIGVNSQIVENQNSEIALKEGVWRVGNFNTPTGKAIRSESSPIILASHVYGYDYWTEDFRERVSFRGLSNLIPGDIIEIHWDQRKYTYEIKFGEINTEISNYSDYDLILYTCEDLSGSENRVIRYAKLINDISY